MRPPAKAKEVIVLSSSPSLSVSEEREAEATTLIDNNSSIKKKKKREDGATAEKQEKTNKNNNLKKKKPKPNKKKEKKKTMMANNASTTSSSSSSSTTLAAAGTRSSVCFPMSRVWRLVRGEGGYNSAGSNNKRTTLDAVFLINKASEMFLGKFAEDAYNRASKEQQKSITYQHLSSTVYNGKRYEFLSDFVPEKLRGEDALKARSLLET